MISSLLIEGFRGLPCLKLTGLGRVNLITGRNNTGKSTVLEALRILASKGQFKIFLQLLQDREQDIGENDDNSTIQESDILKRISVFFNEFPTKISDFKSVKIESASRKNLKNDVFVEFGIERYIGKQLEFKVEEPNSEEQLDGDLEKRVAFYVKSNEHKRLYPLEENRLFYGKRVYFSNEDAGNTPCVYVSPYIGSKTGDLYQYWDKIALTEGQKDVEMALRIIDEKIEAVNMIGLSSRFSKRTAIVKAKNNPAPIPLRSYGDGMNRIFGMILCLVNAKNGIILFDEIENGLHYSIQGEVWDLIFKIANQLNIQVFATTHSRDTVESFQCAAKKSNEEGVLIKLVKKGDNIIPVHFDEDELEIVKRDNIEVR